MAQDHGLLAEARSLFSILSSFSPLIEEGDATCYPQWNLDLESELSSCDFECDVQAVDAPSPRLFRGSGEPINNTDLIPVCDLSTISAPRRSIVNWRIRPCMLVIRRSSLLAPWLFLVLHLGSEMDFSNLLRLDFRTLARLEEILQFTGVIRLTFSDTTVEDLETIGSEASIPESMSTVLLTSNVKKSDFKELILRLHSLYAKFFSIGYGSVFITLSNRLENLIQSSQYNDDLARFLALVFGVGLYGLPVQPLINGQELDNSRWFSVNCRTFLEWRDRRPETLEDVKRKWDQTICYCGRDCPRLCHQKYCRLLVCGPSGHRPYIRESVRRAAFNVFRIDKRKISVDPLVENLAENLAAPSLEYMQTLALRPNWLVEESSGVFVLNLKGTFCLTLSQMISEVLPNSILLEAMTHPSRQLNRSSNQFSGVDSHLPFDALVKMRWLSRVFPTVYNNGIFGVQRVCHTVICLTQCKEVCDSKCQGLLAGFVETHNVRTRKDFIFLLWKIIGPYCAGMSINL